VAQDATSIARYGQRDQLIAVGSNTTAAAAARVRDRKLAASKDEVWRGEQVTVRRHVRRKGGAPWPAWSVKVGDRVKLCSVMWPNGHVFVVGQTSYDADAETMALSPLDMPDRVDMWISRLEAKVKK
jgi:hypothetical protein